MKIKQLGYLSAALLLTLSACGNEGNNNDENGDDEEIVVIPVEATTIPWRYFCLLLKYSNSKDLKIRKSTTE